MRRSTYELVSTKFTNPGDALQLVCARITLQAQSCMRRARWYLCYITVYQRPKYSCYMANKPTPAPTTLTIAESFILVTISEAVMLARVWQLALEACVTRACVTWSKDWLPT